MNSRGFTLVEMIAVLAIISILAALAAMNWNAMVIKAAVEGQVKTVHADLMAVRLDALYSKRVRSATVIGKEFKIYSSADVTAAPVSSRMFKYNFISPPGNTVASNTITFNMGGMSNSTQNTLCVDPFNDTTAFTDATVDSIVISQARLNLGKRTGNCDADGVTQK